MKMTMGELLNWPKGLSLEEYEKQRTAQKRRDSRIRKLADERDELEDALQVLEDEKGSERYIQKAKRLEEVNAEISRLTA